LAGDRIKNGKQMVSYWRQFGLWLLLSAGMCGVGSNIAALFGYTGQYTLELAVGCIVISLAAAAVSYRLLKRKVAASPQFRRDLELIRARSYQGWTKAQRLRWFVAWMGAGVVFPIFDFIAYQTTRHLFPNLMPQMVTVVALSISGSLAALFGVFFYQRVLTDTFPDRNENDQRRQRPADVIGAGGEYVRKGY
jgi:hypothetical protein